MRSFVVPDAASLDLPASSVSPVSRFLRRPESPPAGPPVSLGVEARGAALQPVE